jgi:hypothetical protein
MPPAGAAGGRIGIVHEKREALRALGAPDHDRAGDTFLPEQPKLLNTCSSAIGVFGLMSGLVSVKGWASARLATARPAVRTALLTSRAWVMVSSLH